jgi:hypothetical protein
MRSLRTWFAVAAMLAPSVAATAPSLKAVGAAAGGFGAGHSWIMGQFDETPNQTLKLSDFERTTLAAFHALTGGADVLTATGVEAVTAAVEENARSAHSKYLAKMDLDADGNVSESEVRSFVLATPSRFGEDYRINRTMKADRDKNGMIDPQESQRAAQESAELIALNAKAAYQIMSLDSNADGELTNVEILTATERVFAFVDTDKDDYANSGEICIARGPLIDRKGLHFGTKTCF